MSSKDPNVHKSPRLRVALLTPYTGENLGDAAIQDAVIANVRQRFEDAHICLISYRPDVTAGIHRVPSFPIGITTFSSASLREYTYSACRGGAVKARGVFDEILPTIKRWIPFYAQLRGAALSIVPASVGRIARDVLHTKRAYRLVAGFDAVIVSGGGQLDEYFGGPWRHPYSLFKWGLIARLSGAGYLFLSVGACSIKSRLSRFFLRCALRLATYRSYRDHKSKQLLKDMTFTHGDLVCPDLAFSDVGAETADDEAKQRQVIGISPISYLSRKWKETNLDAYDTYLDSLSNLVRYLVGQGLEVVIFSTDAVDLESLDDLERAIRASLDSTSATRVSRASTTTLQDLRRCLSRLDLVVASRLHGVILSHRAGLPVLAIAYDRKVTTYMSDTDMSEFCVGFLGIDGDTLRQTFRSLVQDAGSIRSKLKRINARYSETLTLQYDRVLGV